MESSLDSAANGTIDLLEARLRRIEYVVRGHLDNTSDLDSQKPVTTRLAKLEASLYRLKSSSRVIQELLKLHTKHADLFHATPSDGAPKIMDTQAIFSTVLACASSYHLTASQLTSILDLPLPTAGSSTLLIDLQPRIAKVETLQQSQARDIAVLKQRTSALLQRWYAIDILCTGEYWADVEGKVELMEQQVRRAMATREDEFP